MALSELAEHRAVGVQATACQEPYAAERWRHIRKIHRPMFVFVMDGRGKRIIAGLEQRE
jgi:hypothetical protein